MRPVRVSPQPGAGDATAATEQDQARTPSTTLTFAGAPDAFDNLTPPRELLSQLKNHHVWSEAGSTVVHLLRDSAFGGVTAWLAGLLFTFGNYFTGQSAEDQSYATFCSGVMITMCLLLGVCDGMVHAASMIPLHFVDHPDRHPTLGECIRRLARKTWLVCVIMTVAIGGASYGLAALPSSTHPFKLHFYIGVWIHGLQVVYMDFTYRRIYQLETTEGTARGHRHRGGYCVQFMRMFMKDMLLFVLVFVAAAFVHVSVAMRLESTSSLLIFSLSSYLFKLLAQEATKTVILHQKKTNVKSIYVAVATPTVLIDTQIRVVNLRQSSVSQSIAGSVAISVVEVMFRFMKVWLIRLEIWAREKKVVKRIRKKLQRQSGIDHESTGVQRDQVVHLPSTELKSDTVKIHSDKDYLEFLQWRRRLLRFHAAEIHADMYAEYLAIVCSMAIYFFFHDHPKYAWKATGSTVPAASSSSSSSASPSLDWKGQAVYLVVQLVMEMVIDALSCVWELSNGVPLHNSKQMRAFIAALFVCAGVMNLVLSAALTIKGSDAAS